MRDRETDTCACGQPKHELAVVCRACYVKSLGRPRTSLRAWLEDWGHSTEELAAQLGRSERTVRRYANGETSPEGEDLIRLHEITGIDWQTLIRRE